MHILQGVQVLHSLANISEISLNFVFEKLAVAELNFIMQSPGLGIL